jgi:hypothetical protein
MSPLLPPTPALRSLLSDAGVESVAELASKPVDELMPLLQSTQYMPPSEIVLGALVLNTVDQLRQATNRLDQGSAQMLRLTRWAVALAVASVVVALVALVLTLLNGPDVQVVAIRR